VLLNAALSGLQIVVGVAFGSIALIGDALHNVSDVMGLLLGWGAESLSKKPARGRFSYGFGRSTQLAAVANAVLILMASAVVCVEALQRFREPQLVTTGPVAIAAGVGLVVNLLSARLFGSDHHDDLNRRAAVLHLLGDAAVSAAVLLSALAAGLTGWTWIDPVTGLGVGLSLGWLGIMLLRDGLAELMDEVPRRIDPAAVLADLQAMPGVQGVHHLHIWSIGGTRVALTVHLQRDAALSHQDPQLLSKVRQVMQLKGIEHCTVQLEELDEDCGETLS
jgi:cobalt-zinc-cadmium efflux system protein